MSTTMLMVGAVAINRAEPAGVFRHVGEFLHSADIVIGNLEGPYAYSGTPWPKGGGGAVWRA
jgi:hypothetical protein